MPRKTKEPKHTSPPPDASLLGIPPEMRNAIYQLVADDIDEVSIIGHKLGRSRVTSKDDTWLWNTMAKHPLSQTCRQLRQEFDPVHRRRALTTGVAQYRLELEDYDTNRVAALAIRIKHLPKIVQDQLKKSLDHYDLIVRFNLTDNIFVSIKKFEDNWRALHLTFSELRRALDVRIHTAYYSHEVNLNFRDPTMSPARKRISPTQDQVGAAKREMKKTSADVSRELWPDSRDRLSASLLVGLYNKLKEAHNNHFRTMREAREGKASKVLESRLKAKLREELKAELRAELRAEIMDELKAEAEAEAELEE